MNLSIIVTCFGQWYGYILYSNLSMGKSLKKYSTLFIKICEFDKNFLKLFVVKFLHFSLISIFFCYFSELFQRFIKNFLIKFQRLLKFSKVIE